MRGRGAHCFATEAEQRLELFGVGLGLPELTERDWKASVGSYPEALRSNSSVLSFGIRFSFIKLSPLYPFSCVLGIFCLVLYFLYFSLSLQCVPSCFLFSFIFIFSASLTFLFTFFHLNPCSFSLTFFLSFLS